MKQTDHGGGTLEQAELPGKRGGPSPPPFCKIQRAQPRLSPARMKTAQFAREVIATWSNIRLFLPITAGAEQPYSHRELCFWFLVT